MLRTAFHLALVAAALIAGTASAQTFPSRPLRLVVPFPPGGPTDVMARAIAARLATTFGQPVVVDNKPGANTIIAADFVAKAEADGHTFLFTPPPAYSINPLLYAKLPYSPQADLAPVVAVATLPECLIVNADVPVKNLKEFIAYAKANPGKINYGSFGAGSSPHLAAEGFKAQTGTDIVHIPFKGAVDLQHALLKGEVHAMFASPNAVLPLIKEGKLRVLAAYGPTRIAQLPDVPTYGEEGLKGLEMNTWFGVFVPAKTPEATVQILANQIDRVVADPEFRSQRLTPYTFVPAAPGRENFQKMLQADLVLYKRFVQAANVKLD